MGTSQRLDVTSKSARELPGPGQYSSNKQFGADAVTFSMRGKVQEKQREDIPGPGSYNALDAINRDKSPSFRMGTS